jgi:molecular chaperone DnaK
MERTTIDFGIDLGTTNSSIAVLEGTGTRVFKNNEGREYTSSAVWIDNKGKLYVGRLAKEQLEYDSDNAYSEFKLQMGTSQLYLFARSGRQMKPEELSAEVLKSLRGDAQQQIREEVVAAAIGVPADFELPHCDATNKAAKLAGLSFSPLVQEPVAAALAYGFQGQSDRVFWMVYDFGGGTFDVAIIQVRDGQIQVVNHSGDNHLGGKLIDYEIVDQLFAPALVKEYALTDFKRGNPKWKAAFAKLKLYAEEHKIRLSRDKETDVIIDPLCKDDKGMWVRFEYELKRSEIEPLIEPFVERSINKCKKTLEEKRLSPDDIEKIILVGGPTLTPILREILSAKLKIPLESRVDPLTVNAQGAAIFAGTQPMPKDVIQKRRPVPTGQYSVELEYEPIGNESEPLVGGVVIAPEGKSLVGFTIEFAEAKTKWRSGKISIAAEGKFMTNVHAGERTNEFLIELRDGAGNLCPTVPDRFNYTLGMTISGQPLIHSVGVALANNEVQIFLSKGTPLPAHKRSIHRTTVPLKKGESGTLLKIPVVEGENIRRDDRNSLIGTLEISGASIRRDLPLGSEVEITIDIDESRLVQTKAYIPILDEWFDDVHELVKGTADPQKLADEFKREQARLEEVRGKAQQTGIAPADKPLQRIQDEGMVHDVEASLAAAEADPDAAQKCEKRLRDLKSAIDEVEDALEWPTLVSEAEKQIENTREIVDKYGKGDDRRDFDSLEKETRAAIAAHNADLLHQKIEQLGSLTTRILIEQPGFWVGWLEYLEERKSHMRDQALAEQLIAQGRHAIDTNDINGLKAVVRQLIGLLPVDEQREARGYGGTTMPI